MPTALAAMPPKPKIAATTAMMKKTAAQYSMVAFLSSARRERVHG
jgi:hypothetical protein